MFNLEGATPPRGHWPPFSSNDPLVKLVWAIFYIMWLGKYWAVCYFHLKSNENDPLKDFLDWTTGGVQVSLTKKLWQSYFFFLVLSLFYRSQMVNFKEIYHFSRFPWGSNIFQGVQLCPGGVQLLIPYRNPYNLWFSRGGPDPLSPPPPPPPPSGSALGWYPYHLRTMSYTIWRGG